MDAKAARVFADTDTYATCLLALGVDRFVNDTPGNKRLDMLGWAPDTWATRIKHLCGVDVPVRNVDKLAAACLVLTQPDEFYTSSQGFNDITIALAGEWFDPHVWHPPTTEEALWATAEVFLLDPPDDRDAQRFSPEIVRYVNMIARHEGFQSLPPQFPAFGIPVDHSLPPAADYSGDPDTAAVAAYGSEQRMTDLGSWLVDRFAELAEQIRALPLSSRSGHTVADELLAALPR